jgi:hypothetical protein
MPSRKNLADSGISKVPARSEVISPVIVASAANIDVVPVPGGPKSAQLRTEDWQRQSWHWMDRIGEYRYGCEWVGNQLSKAKLLVLEKGKPTTNTVALELMAGFFGGVEGQQQMLRTVGINFTAAGECYVALSKVDGADFWETAASTQISRGSQPKSFRINEELRENAFVLRLWRPHPERARDADAAARSMLGVLGVIDGLGQHEQAQIHSRLAGAGLLLLPQEITFQTTEITDAQGNKIASNSDPNAFSKLLAETMAQAVANRGSASSLVPIMLQGPGEHLEKIRHLTFWTELDEKTTVMQEQAMARLARSMDMPPEILTGSGDMNHWGAWQMDEASIKSHTQPLLDVIIHSLTTHYLQPLLAAAGVANAEDFTIDADTSEMRLRPNRSKEAAEMYDRGELSGEAMRRENGFSEDDAPTDDQRTEWLLKNLAGGSASPEQLQAALEALGVRLRVAPTAPVVVNERIREAQPPRSLEEHPTQDPPEEPVDPAVVASAEMHVLRALERAGNRIKSGYRVSMPDVPAVELYRHVDVRDSDLDSFLEDGFSLAQHSSFACNTPALSEYTRQLLKGRSAPTIEGITAALRGA